MTVRPLRIASCGVGRMGSLVAQVAQERGHDVALRLGSAGNREGCGLGPEALRGIDVVMEFSGAGSALLNARRAAEAGCAVVVGATGFDAEAGRAELARLAEAHGVGILASPNFSLGMRLFRLLAERAAELAAADEEIDVLLEERHHGGKADHPGGTALQLARVMLERLPRKTSILTELPAGRVPADGLLVSASRGGWQPGLHRIVLDAPEESITLVHEARSRRAFALGAVRAAEWLAGRKGLFTLDDMLSDTLRTEDAR